MCFCECKQHACEGQKRARNCLSLELPGDRKTFELWSSGTATCATKPLFQTPGRKRVPKLGTKLVA